MSPPPLLPPPRARQRLLFVGKTGMGKSFAVKANLRVWAKAGARICALDPKDEYSRQGAIRGGPLRRRVTLEEVLAEPELLAERRLSLAVVPGRSTYRAAQGLRALCAAAPRFGPLVLVLGELGLATDATMGGTAAQVAVKARAELVALATMGREDGISLVLDCQRATQAPKGARSQISDVVAFRQDEASDVTWLVERTRDNRFARAADLPEHEALVWSDSTAAAPSDESDALAELADVH